MARKYKRIGYAERLLIERLLSQGKSISNIAQEVGTCRMAIYNELKRCKPYSADVAQRTR